METVQLPPEAVAAAGGVMAYSVICMITGLWMVWLLWVHHERDSCMFTLSALRM